jgi:hypothetical protein
MQDVERTPATRRLIAIELNFIICMFLFFSVISSEVEKSINIEGAQSQGPGPFAIY